MKDKNDSQKFANRLLSILGENKWREARWVLVAIVIALGVILSRPEFMGKKPDVTSYGAGQENLSE